jgi:hypothetical protein
MSDTELRELDAWIAEHVMFYKRTEQPDSHTDAGDPLFWDSGKAVVISRPYFSALHKKYAHSWSKFGPTTDRAAAMAVLEKCVEIGLLSISMQGGSPRVWRTDGELKITNAETLPLAICKFAKEIFQ